MHGKGDDPQPQALHIRPEVCRCFKGLVKYPDARGQGQRDLNGTSPKDTELPAT